MKKQKLKEIQVMLVNDIPVPFQWDFIPPVGTIIFKAETGEKFEVTGYRLNYSRGIFIIETKNPL